MANKTNYLLQVLIWQNANMGVKKAKQTKKPEPFIPEFMKEKSPINKEAVAHTTDDIRSILNTPRG